VGFSSGTGGSGLLTWHERGDTLEGGQRMAGPNCTFFSCIFFTHLFFSLLFFT
jgi:hypothetical protein